jgi:hypothetical protein
MKTLQKTITAYSFNELDNTVRDDAKRNVLDRERLPDFFSEDLKMTLAETYGLHHLKTFYSLSSCQGDGLCLYGKITFSELFENEKFKKIAFKGLHHTQIKTIKDTLQKIDFIHNSRYYHAKTVNIESHECDPTDRQIAIIDCVIENVKTWYFSFCRDWERYGYDYFYEISDEDMGEVCEENEFLFTESGNLIDTNEYLEQTAS